MTTGQRIKAARKKAKLTQKELGAKLGIAYQTLAQWENDLRNPKYETLQRIAAALEIDWSELVPESNKDTVLMDHINLAFKHGMENGTSDPVLDGFWQGWEKNQEKRWYVFGYTHSETELNLIKYFSCLNEDGQEKAVERVQELTEIPKYQKEKE